MTIISEIKLDGCCVACLLLLTSCYLVDKHWRYSTNGVFFAGSKMFNLDDLPAAEKYMADWAASQAAEMPA
jgi:hypothetical protein